MIYHTKAVGVLFENRQQILANLPVKVNVDFERDRDNKFDPNAVNVLANGQMIGYLSKGHWVSKALDKGKKFIAKGIVTGGIDEFGNKINYGLNIEFELIEENNE